MLDQFVGGRADIACKWPNDVLLNGRKAVGILLESETDGKGGLAWLSIGIGVNLAWHPDIAERPATSLAAAGITPPHPHDALSLLAMRFTAWLARWNTEGFAPVKHAWIERASRIGEEIEVRLDKEALHGIFTALDDSGALVLQMPGGAVRRITAGDVFFPEV